MNNGMNNFGNGNSSDMGATRDLNSIIDNVMGVNSNNNTVEQNGFNGDFGMQYQGPRAPQTPAVEQPTQAPSMQAPTPEQPAQAPSMQVPTPEQPAQAPSMQMPTPEQPAQAPSMQMPTPEQPAQAPSMQVPTPEQPAQAPSMPTPTPEQPAQAPSIENQQVNNQSVINPFLSKMDDSATPETNTNIDNSLNVPDNSVNSFGLNTNGSLPNQEQTMEEISRQPEPTPNQALFGAGLSQNDFNMPGQNPQNDLANNNIASQGIQIPQDNTTNNAQIMQNSFDNINASNDMFNNQINTNLNSGLGQSFDNQAINIPDASNNYQNMNQNSIGVNPVEQNTSQDLSSAPKKKFPLSLREIILIAIAIAGVITVIVIYS